MLLLYPLFLCIVTFALHVPAAPGSVGQDDMSLYKRGGSKPPPFKPSMPEARIDCLYMEVAQGEDAPNLEYFMVLSIPAALEMKDYATFKKLITPSTGFDARDFVFGGTYQSASLLGMQTSLAVKYQLKQEPSLVFHVRLNKNWEWTETKLFTSLESIFRAWANKKNMRLRFETNRI